MCVRFPVVKRLADTIVSDFVTVGFCDVRKRSAHGDNTGDRGYHLEGEFPGKAVKIMRRKCRDRRRVLE